LIAIEYGLRLALKTDTAGFVGPTLATAAAGQLVPALALKSKTATLSTDLQQEIAKLKVTVYSRADERIAFISLVLLLASIAAWVWTLVLAEQKDTITILTLDRPVFIGLVCYLIAVLTSEFKETT
jgi:hypothetical protein